MFGTASIEDMIAAPIQTRFTYTIAIPNISSCYFALTKHSTFACHVYVLETPVAPGTPGTFAKHIRHACNARHARLVGTFGTLDKHNEHDRHNAYTWHMSHSTHNEHTDEDRHDYVAQLTHVAQ